MTHQTNFSVGNLVQIIDPDEHPTEWATFGEHPILEKT